MGNTIKLKNDAEYLYDKGSKYADDGDFLTALDYFYRSYEKNHDYETLADIAVCYEGLGEYEEALRTYYEMFAIHSDDSETFVDVVECLVQLGRTGEAVYYITYCGNNDIFEGLFDVENAPKEGGKFHVLDRYDNTAAVAIAQKLIRHGESDYALEILRDVPEKSPSYIEALNLIAAIYFEQEKYINATIVCDTVLAVDEKNVEALTTKIVCLYCLNDMAQVDALKKVVLSVETEKSSEIEKIALAMQQIKDDENALKYYLKLSSYKTYDRNTNLAIAILYHNLGKSDLSHKTLVYLAKLYPMDKVVKYYGSRLYYDEERCEVSFDLPVAEQKKRIEYLEGVLTKLKDVGKITERAKKDEEFLETIEWLLFSQQTAVSGHVANFLAQHKFWHPLIRSMLVSPDVVYRVKRECLGTFLKYADKKSFAMYVQDIVLFYHPKRPKIGENTVLADAYWNVYALLAFMSEGFDKAINNAYKKFCAVLDKVEFTFYPGAAELSALFAVTSALNPFFSEESEVCHIVGADPKQYGVLKKLYDEAKEK